MTSKSQSMTRQARALRRAGDGVRLRWAWLGLVLAATIWAAPKAGAATATANLLVTATVSANCTISTTALAFGSYDPVVAHASTNLNASGTVTVACTKGTTGLSIGMGNGGNFSGGTRRMAGGGDFLTYSLFRPPNNTPGTACTFPGALAWGTTIGTNTLALTNSPSKAGRTYNVCGTITAGQDVTVASYSDTVVATINF